MITMPPTSGPWYVKRDGLYLPEIFSEQFADKAGPMVVARAYSWREDGAKYLARASRQALKERRMAEAWANATLIAAAPELLEACIALQMEAAARGCGLKIADDAIAKATGKT